MLNSENYSVVKLRNLQFIVKGQFSHSLAMLQWEFLFFLSRLLFHFCHYRQGQDVKNPLDKVDIRSAITDAKWRCSQTNQSTESETKEQRSFLHMALLICADFTDMITVYLG